MSGDADSTAGAPPRRREADGHLTDSGRGPRVLVAIPAFNEAVTIREVVSDIRLVAPEFDVLVVDDGSTDGTQDVLLQCDVIVATHLCNLGYARAIQTAIRYAQKHEYDAVITFDADGQHQPADLQRVYDEFVTGAKDLVIGSRFVEHRSYRREPVIRRLGMVLFSAVIRVVAGRRIYDTSSGLRVIGRRLFDLLTTRPVVDFHAETLVFLLRSGYSVAECPISVDVRRHGHSMYGSMTAVTYPLKVLFLIIVGALDAQRRSRGRGG